MSKKKQLTLDSNTGKLSRLKSKDLPLVGISGINDGDELAAFGTLQTDVIESLESSDFVLFSTFFLLQFFEVTIC